MKKILISAGEPSGDLHASMLIEQLRTIDDVTFYGMGGDKMREAGCNILYDYSGLSLVGFSEIVSKLGTVKKAMRTLSRFILEEKPSLVVLIDYPGFNLRLARMAKLNSIPVVYYVSPQLWAWGRWRIRSIERYVDQLICILPFETDFYSAYSIETAFVGHPLLDVVSTRMTREELCRKLGIDTNALIIGFLPGSRREEIRRVLPIMIGVKRLLDEQIAFESVLVAHREMSGEVTRVLHKNQTPMRCVEEDKYEVIRHADLLICTSGTVTLEALMLATPMLILYKVSLLSWLIGRALVKIPFIGLVNIIAGREIAREFVQFEATPPRIAEASIEALQRGDEIRQELLAARKKLGEKGAARRAATLVGRVLNPHS